MNIQTWQAINAENVTLVVHWLVTTRQLKIMSATWILICILYNMHKNFLTHANMLQKYKSQNIYMDKRTILKQGGTILWHCQNCQNLSDTLNIFPKLTFTPINDNDITSLKLFVFTGLYLQEMQADKRVILQ
jgi:hypothetical protein